MWVALTETGIQGGPVHTLKALEDSGSSFTESGNWGKRLRADHRGLWPGRLITS